MNTSVIQQASYFNLVGVQLIENGQEMEAVQAFTHSLSVIARASASSDTMALVAPVKKEETSSHEAVYSKNSPESSGCISNSTEAYSPRNTCNSAMLRNLEDNHFFVFNQAMIFYPDSISEVTALDLCLYSSFIIFNMALSYHQLGKRLRDNCLLQNAVRLYSKNQRFLEKMALDTGMNLSKYLAATVNNKAHIYIELFDENQVQEELKALSQILKQQDTSSEPSNKLFLNTLLFKSKHVIASAA